MYLKNIKIYIIMDSILENFDYETDSDTEAEASNEFEFLDIILPKGILGIILEKTDDDEYIVSSFRQHSTVSHILQSGDLLHSMNGERLIDTCTQNIINLFKNNDQNERHLIIKRFKITPIIHGYIETA